MMHPADMQAGEAITPNVRLKRELGVGGMGSVWVADHLGLQTEVAVKFVAADLADNEQIRERFAREASIAAKIRSPHVVQVFDHGIAPDGLPFIVMELLRGTALSERIAQRGPLTPEEAASVVRQVAKALGKVHEAGVVHRDIKPANVFLTEDDGEIFVKILDFGIAKPDAQAVDALTRTGTALGTPYYMSPEQFTSSRGADARSDLWALSVLAYEALTGRLPYEGETYGAIAVAVANCAYTAVSQRRPELPPALDAWFATAFAFKIGARFQTARELATTFADALNGSYVAPGDSAHGPTVPVRGSLGSQPEIPVAPRPPSAPDLGAEARESSRLAVAHTQLLDSAVNIAPVSVPMREPAASVSGEAAAAAPVAGRSVRGMLLAGGAVVAVLAVAGGALVFAGSRPPQGGAGASLVQPTASVATGAKSADPPLPPPPEPPALSATAPPSASSPAPPVSVAVSPRPVAVGTVVKPRPSVSAAPVAPTRSAAPVPSVKDRGF